MPDVGVNNRGRQNSISTGYRGMCKRQVGRMDEWMLMLMLIQAFDPTTISWSSRTLEDV